MIFIACLITVIIETLFFFLFGYRKGEDMLIIVCCNVVTNLLLNLIIQLLFHGNPGAYIYLLETLVVLTEFLIYSAAYGKNFKLFCLVLAANCLTYGIGLLIF